MHAKVFLHKLLDGAMHQKRLSTLKDLVDAGLEKKTISVTSLGRSIQSPAQQRSNIRRSDRFIGNEKVNKERMNIFGINAKLLVGPRTRPIIIVDLSNIPNTTHHVLRAALALSGRTITLYEEVHPKVEEGSPEINKKFLWRLKNVLPKECKPIIVTDAGFHNPWFKEIEALGWDYIGRIRGRKHYRKKGRKKFVPCKELFSEATGTGKYIGEVELCPKNVIKANLYLIKKKKKGRHALNKAGKKRRGKKDKEYTAAAYEPWLLATSLPNTHTMVKKVFKIYALRMRIEESFRDLKSSQYGFGFEKARTKNICRIEILLLIAMLAILIAWLVGCIAEKNNWQLKYQANSTKNRRILSLFFLGYEVLKKKDEKETFTVGELFDAANTIWSYPTCAA